MNKRVFVPDLQTGHPPLLHVRVVPVGNVNAFPAAQPAFIAMIEIFQPVQIVQVPSNRRMLAIDLERVKRLVSARVASRLKRGERAIAETNIRTLCETLRV